MSTIGRALAALVAFSLLLPGAAVSARAKHPKRVTVHPRAHGHGYGFLPGYHQPPSLADWRDRSRRAARPDRDRRFINLYTGQVGYGWGPPRFYRGQWNGGSFGPCWKYTPIGMMPTCGQ